MKKKSLLLRVTVLSLVLGMVAMLLSGGILYALFRDRAEANMKKTLNENVNRMAYQLVRYQSYDWLLPYWQEHYKKMALPPFGDIDTYLKWGEERGAFERLNAAALTPQAVMEMSEEEQRLFAEYCYFYRMKLRNLLPMALFALSCAEVPPLPPMVDIPAASFRTYSGCSFPNEGPACI